MKTIASGAVFFLICSGLLAQSESGGAALEGSVSDPSGTLIPSAQVTIRQAQIGLERKITANGEGQFRAGALPVGLYTVEAAASGFGPVRVENIDLTVGVTKSLKLTLQIAAVSTIDSATGKAISKPAVARPDATIGQLNVNKSVGHSSYNGTYVRIQRRMSHRVQFGFNYTYSFNRDDDSNERDFNRQYMLNTYNLKPDAARAKNDIRHSGNVNVLFDLGRGFMLSSLLMAHTGSPGRYVIGSDLNNDGNKDNDRPVIDGVPVPRDSTRYESFFDWDMRLIKEFKLTEKMRLDFSIEGYNLTRARNTTFNGDGDSFFGKPTTTVNPATGFFYATNTAGIPLNSPGTDRFGGPRQGQIGVRFIF